MKKEIKIEGMSCEHCVMAVKRNLSKLDLRKIDVKIGTASIEFDETKINEKDIDKAIFEAGYKIINWNK